VEVVEAVEAGALDDGGSGSSHGRLQSSRQTALPRADPIPPSPPFTSPSPPACRWADRGVDSPEAARVGRSPGVSAVSLIAAGGAGTRGRPGCAGGRGACRALALAVIQRGKDGNDEGDVSATPS
jgi:hypothetical protein